MKILVIGKYPPIEGGVSAETYWLCRRLAEQGHQVHVVTNALEVENEYRMFLDQRVDGRWMEAQFPATGGSLQVRWIERFSNRRMSHIPQANPYVSRLASVAAQVCNDSQCEVILAYYLEPYGVAAHMVSMWTGIPYVIKHAGSDLDRLMTVPDLAETYRQVVASAAAVLTRPDLAARFLRMGLEPSRIITDLGSYLPPVFEPSGPALDVDALCRAVADSEMKSMMTVPPPLGKFDDSLPTIGIYGKIGRAKGSYDLVSALGKIRDQGIRFNLLCLSNGVARSEFLDYIAQHKLQNRSWILPFLPHWRVPEFLRRCTVVCFLERDFPVAIHGPQVPREVMSCGRCLIVSDEIVRKQPFLFSAESSGPPSAIVVKDPKDVDSLAGAILPLLQDIALASVIGQAGYRRASERLENGDAGVTASVLDRVSRLATRDFASSSIPIQRVGWQMIAASLLPWSFQIIEKSAPETWASATRDEEQIPPLHPLEQAMAMTELLLFRLEDQNFARQFPAYFHSVLKLEQHQVRIFLNNRITRKPFGRADVLGDRRLTASLSRTLWPLRDRYCEIHACDYEIADLQRIFESTDSAIPEPARRRSHVLLVPQSNFALKMFRMSPGALRVFELCNGAACVDAIVETVLENQDRTKTDRLETQVLELIGQLYKRTAITFVSETRSVGNSREAVA